MNVIRTISSVLALAVLILLTACAQRGPDGPDPSKTTAAPGQASPADGLVVQVTHTGGFLTPELVAARLPLVSVYADGRIITQGPQTLIHPSPALPDLRVQHVDEDAVRTLVDRALQAGVGDSTDLGQPPVADAPSTRFTVVTEDETYVREVYALGAESPPGPPGGDLPGGTAGGLTAEQEAARADLRELVRVLSDPAAAFPADTIGESEPYIPDAVAGVVTQWTDPQADMERQPVPWPGPPLPGEPLLPQLGVNCVLATGEEADAVLAAASSADSLTPWLSEDGQRWSIILRPMLPHEDSCADLGEPHLGPERSIGGSS